MKHLKADGTVKKWTHLSLMTFHSAWIRTLVSTKLPTANALRVALLFYHYSQMSDSVIYYMKTGKVYCWPGVNRIATDLNISEDTVRRSTRHLEEFRLVSTIESNGGSSRTNHYKLLPRKLKRSTTNNPPIDKRKTPRSLSGGNVCSTSMVIKTRVRKSSASRFETRERAAHTLYRS